MRAKFLILATLFLATAAHAQFSTVSRGPLAGGCNPPAIGLDVVNNVIYSCGGSPPQWAANTGSGTGTNCNSLSAVLFQAQIGQPSGCDANALLDGLGNLVAVTGTFQSLIANTIGTSGTGGILDFALQLPPGSVPSGHIQLFGNTANGLLACLNSSLTSCLGSVQLVTSGSTTLPATTVTANGGCNIYSSTATGATSTNSAFPSLHGVDVSTVSGYAPGQLEIYPPFTGTNLVSFKVCNPTTSNITPASLTVFWVIE